MQPQKSKGNWKKLPIKYFPFLFSLLFLLVVSTLFIKCKKSSTEENSGEIQSGSVSIIFTAENDQGLARILLVNISNIIQNNSKTVASTSRLVVFSDKMSFDLDNLINSIVFDSEKQTSNSSDGYLTYFENRLKQYSNYESTVDISQSELLEFLQNKELSVNMKSKRLQKNTALEEIDKITGNIAKTGVHQAIGCAKPGPGCWKRIKDLTSAIGDLWKYNAEKIGKALEPSDPYNTDDLAKDLNSNPQTNDPQGNNQQTIPSKGGGGMGDPHLRTMDGLYYDFQGFGEFIALKSNTDNFEIQVRQGVTEEYKDMQVTVTLGIAINTGTDKVCLYPDQFYINGQVYQYDEQTWNLNGGAMSYQDGEISVTIAQGDLIKANLNFSKFFDYTVSLSESRKGNVKGLLGNFDDYPQNDVQLLNGTLVNPYEFQELYPNFANSWRVVNSLFVYTNGQTTNDFSNYNFPTSQPELDEAARTNAEAICRQNGITEDPYLHACIIDVGLSGSSNYAISAARAAQSKVQIKNFDIVNFTSFQSLDLIPQGNAQISSGELYLTHSNSNEVGAVYKLYKADISGGFETSFDILLSEPGGIMDEKNRIGGDGLALVIQDYNPVNTPLSSGQGLGYDGIPRSVAIEFDTYNNGSGENPDDISLNTQGLNPNSVFDNQSLVQAQTRALPKLNDGQSHSVTVKYLKAGSSNYRLEVYIDSDLSPYLVADNINVQKLIGSNNNGVYMGFTASTAGAYENHVIKKWKFSAN